MTTKAELLRVIKLQCQECMGSMKAREGKMDTGAALLVEGCTAPKCSLFPYRSGKDPRPGKKGNIANLHKAQKANAVRQRKPQISTISPGGMF
jgi:hypothetical protein